ncbi:peptidoglycan-binding domain-containing protein [Amycolatopsis nigrescens]|uniref:peptidoglycan-binding domain-containing protein n=1 Tax=Amycolatopsis nigrescens TaxID=381445 RepID=UPI00058BDB3F|nr:peptidoglycan-binding protein [Amycolatopsis nigrescens]
MRSEVFGRRRLTQVAAAAVLTLAVAAPAQASALVALPAANMEAVLKAAQIDPRRADSALTPGSKDSVLLVEQALAAKGLLTAQYVDGHFGTSTISAYAAYQRSLGYTGIDASGLPGQTSLQKLGAERFTVGNVVTAGAKVTYHGALMNTRTKAMLVAAEGLLGRQLGITQGSYNPGGVGGSAGTHDGGGALDISVSGMTAETRTTVARNLRKVGFAAWVRTPSQGDWGYHIHAIAVSDPDQSSGAQHQAGDYYLGLNGLANRGADDGPVVTPKLTWEEYQRS